MKCGANTSFELILDNTKSLGDIQDKRWQETEFGKVKAWHCSAP